MIRKKVEAKNSLENYCYTVKNSVNDEKLKDKFSEEDKKAVLDAVNAGTSWLESNQEAPAEAYEAKQKEI